MGLTKSLLLGAVASACASQAVQSQPPAELLDLAARVHYGYYHADARAIETAEAALDRLPDSPEVLYYRDFAALRRVQPAVPAAPDSSALTNARAAMLPRACRSLSRPMHGYS